MTSLCKLYSLPSWNLQGQVFFILKKLLINIFTIVSVEKNTSIIIKKIISPALIS